jgi:hypothetical protein
MAFIGNRTNRKIILQPIPGSSVTLEPMGYAEISEAEQAGIKKSKVGQSMLDRGQLILAQRKEKMIEVPGKLTHKKPPEADTKSVKVKGGVVDPVKATVVKK